jgi:hypothetical protein
LVEKRMFEKNKDYPLGRSLSVLNMQKHNWFVSSFEHVKFSINEKYSKKHCDNPNYYVSLVIFQTYKNVILKSVHSLWWLLWLCFYPRAIKETSLIYLESFIHTCQFWIEYNCPIGDIDERHRKNEKYKANSS